MTVAQLEASATTTRSGFVMAGVWIIVVGVIYLQRLGIPLGSEEFVPLCVLTTYLGMGLILLSRRCAINLSRFALWLAATSGCMLASLLSEESFSLFSLEYLIVLYLPFIFVVDASDEEYRQYANVWQLCMLPIVVLALMQFLAQGKFDPLKEHFSKFLVPGFNTRPVLQYESTFRKSDGLFMLEPSFLSQFCSIALTLEIIYFRKLWRIIAYACGMAASVSLSGATMLSVVILFYAWHYKKIPHVIAGVVVVIGVMWAFQNTQVVQSVLNREDEISGPGSSAYERLIGPLLETDYLVDSFDVFMFGVGPGNSSSDRVIKSTGIPPSMTGGMWPPLKLFVEYGILGTLPALAFFWTCFVGGSRSYIISLMMAIFYIFVSGGALLVPHVVFTVFVVLCLFPCQPESVARHLFDHQLEARGGKIVR